MSAPRQDARIEAVVEAGLAPLAPVLATLRKAIAGTQLGGLVDDLEAKARDGILQALAAAGLDTSAHVTAPEVVLDLG